MLTRGPICFYIQLLHANRQVYNVLKGSILIRELLYNKIHIMGKYVTTLLGARSYLPMAHVSACLLLFKSEL
jgi:hypothetical protein